LALDTKLSIPLALCTGFQVVEVEAEFSAFNSSARDSTINDVVDKGRQYGSIRHVRNTLGGSDCRLAVGRKCWAEFFTLRVGAERKDQVHLLCHDITDIQDLYNLQWTTTKGLRYLALFPIS
jgi:hypothetical protein